jgi:hypothetical protein
MLVIVLTILIVIYILRIAYKIRPDLSITAVKAFRVFHLISAALILAVYILSTKEIYLKGYWAPKIIFWLWYFSGMVLFAFSDKKN